MEATYCPPSGFSDYKHREQVVRILGFVEATIAPGYQSHGTKRCIVAVIADETGRLSTAELGHLTIKQPD